MVLPWRIILGHRSKVKFRMRDDIFGQQPLGQCAVKPHRSEVSTVISRRSPPIFSRREWKELLDHLARDVAAEDLADEIIALLQLCFDEVSVLGGGPRIVSRSRQRCSSSSRRWM